MEFTMSDVLVRAERALSEGDVEAALEALVSYAEQRAQGSGYGENDDRFDTLCATAVTMGTL